jgi:tetratricopeptide (TPR) repeat protein
VAYHSLLGERRRDLHAAVVAAIERMHADRLLEHAERLAHHARQGEVWDKAVFYLRQAGTKCFLRSANRAAATCFEQALDALRRLPHPPDAITEALDIRFDLRNAMLVLGERERLSAVLDEAEALAETIGDERRLGRALNYKVVYLTQSGDFEAALRAGLRSLAIGERLADVAIQVVAHGYLGEIYVRRGECRDAVRHCEAAVAMIPVGLRQERFGQSAIQGAWARNMLAMALGALGRFVEAFTVVREAMHVADEAGHVYSLLFPLWGLGTLKLDHGDFAGAVVPLERGLDLCRKREIPLLLHSFAWALGAAFHRIGRRADGLALMEGAARDAVGWARFAGFNHVEALGRAYLDAGRLADARRMAHSELEGVRRRGQPGGESQLLRLLGDIATHSERHAIETAEAHYREALALAEALGLRPLVAHCHLDLGKLCRRAGERTRAQEYLAMAAMMYREMDMRFWLEQAEAAMTELA